MSAHAIGYRACASALSDLYAMGATPQYLMIALTMPTIERAWMDGFRQGCWEFAKSQNVDIIGGDLTQGVMSCTVHAMGLVALKHKLLIHQAALDDDVWITGNIGGAYAAWPHEAYDQLPKAMRQAWLTHLWGALCRHWRPG